MKLHGVLAVAAVVLGVAGGFGRSASANLLPGAVPDFAITVTSSVGGDSLNLTPGSTQTPGGLFVGTASGQTPSFSFTTDFSLAVDPSVSGSFTLVNLSAASQVFTVSATLGVSPIAAPTRMGGSYGDAVYTDANGDSSVAFSTSGTDPFYTARIDGVGVATRGSFDNSLSGGPGIFGTQSQEVFGAPIPSQVGPGVTTSIGTSFEFIVSPGDSVTTPFEFTVVPEPELLPLFAIGFALFLCAFAQEKAFRAN